MIEKTKRFPRVHMTDLHTATTLEWKMPGQTKCVVRELVGPEDERLEYLRVLTALGERVGLVYNGCGEGRFMVECVKHLMRCRR